MYKSYLEIFMMKLPFKIKPTNVFNLMKLHSKLFPRTFQCQGNSLNYPLS